MIYSFDEITTAKIRSRRFVLKSAVALMFCLLSSTSYGCRNQQPKQSGNFVAKVNGAEIAVREFERRLSENREIVASDFREKYGATVDSDFWRLRFGNQSPLNNLKEKSLRDCVRFKMQQLLAKEKGFVSDIGYDKFFKTFNEENERRKKAVERGEVIYGPRQYTENTYYDYVWGEAFRNLKEQLGRDAFDVSELKLAEYYEINKNERYRRKDVVKVQIISIDFAAGNVENMRSARNKAREIIAEIRERIGADDDSFESAKSYNKSVIFTERILGASIENTDIEEETKLEAKAARLNIGAVSEVFEENKAFHIIKCVDKIANGYFTFDETKEIVKSHYIDERYRLFVDEKVRLANVEINHEVYDNIAVN